MPTATTRLLAVIGDPIEHSLSPLIHGAALAEAKLDFTYVAFRVKNAGEAAAAMRALGIRGFSVTIPHKEAIIPHLDELDAAARHTGSVNTVVNTDGRLKGYSTDGAGAVRALASAGVEPRGRRVLIIGTGGAARAIAFQLAAAGIASLRFQAVVEEQKAALCRDLSASFHGLVVDESEPDLVINTSPVGMSPHTDALPIDPRTLADGTAVFDIVYNPRETRLLREAAARGLVTVSGVEMFVEQAALQFELFTGAAAPRPLMRRVVLDALGR